MPTPTTSLLTVLLATLALAGGAQALAPASASALNTECEEWWECDGAPGGDGGDDGGGWGAIGDNGGWGAIGDNGGWGDPGSGWPGDDGGSIDDPCPTWTCSGTNPEGPGDPGNQGDQGGGGPAGVPCAIWGGSCPGGQVEPSPGGGSAPGPGNQINCDAFYARWVAARDRAQGMPIGSEERATAEAEADAAAVAFDICLQSTEIIIARADPAGGASDQGVATQTTANPTNRSRKHHAKRHAGRAKSSP